MNQAQLMAQVKKMQAEMTKAQEELADTSSAEAPPAEP